MGERIDSAVAVGLDRELLRTMHGTSDLKQKVGEVFELLREPVYYYLITLLGNPADAEDLTQKAFLRLYSCLHKGQTVDNVRAWVFRVAHNLALNRRRNENKVEPIEAEAWDRLCERNLDPAPGAEQRMLELEQHEKFEAALARLSPKERGCFELRAEGLGYREIAEVLGMRTQTLVSFLGRVIDKIIREIYD